MIGGAEIWNAPGQAGINKGAVKNYHAFYMYA
jgi:hypothetical protein